MKKGSFLIVAAILVLFIVPLTSSPNGAEPILSKDVVISNDSTGYYEDFSNVGDWVAPASGSVTTDGNTATFDFWVNGSVFYTAIDASDYYLSSYWLNISAESNLALAYFSIYDGSAYHYVEGFTATGYYGNTIETAEADTTTRLAFELYYGLDFNPTPASPAYIKVEFLDIAITGIGGFAQTIDGDVQAYPDAYHNVTELSYNGIEEDFVPGAPPDPVVSGDYTDTWAEDSSTYDIDYNGAIILYLNTSNTDYESVILDIVVGVTVGEVKIYYYDFNSFTYNYTGILSYGPATTYSVSLVNCTGYDEFRIYFGWGGVTGGSVMSIDYCGLDFYFMSGSNSSYTESFADVSDIDSTSFEAEDVVPSSNGDLVTVECAGSNDWDYFGFDGLDIPFDDGYYFELCSKFNVTTSGFNCRVYLFDTAGYSGDYIMYQCVSSSGTFEVYKFEYSNYYGASGFSTFDNTVNSIRVGIWTNNIGVKWQADYLRIAPADEFGWSYDCSSTEPIVLDGGSGISYSSDGDYLTLQGSTSSWVKIMVDTTSTASSLDTAYYPMLHVAFHADDVGVGDRFAVGIGDASDSFSLIQSATNIIQQDYYYNIKASKNTLKFLYLYVYDNDVVRWDTVQAYGIANHTVTQAGTNDVNDIVYVDAGTLQIECSAGYFTIANDPALYISGYTVWNISTSNLGTAFVLGLYDGSWHTYTDEDTRGEMPSGNVTDYYIQSYVDCEISNILFFGSPPTWHSGGSASVYFDLPEWNLFGGASIHFNVPISQANIDYFFMFVGMILIPTSTMFLVYGGREKMSAEKLLAFLILFVIGCGLILGGLALA